MNKHKWANEIIAWAKGAEIEYLDGTEWAVAYSPVWDEGAQYRIKPQPKEKKSLYVYTDCGCVRVVIDKSIAQGHWTYAGKIEVLND